MKLMKIFGMVFALHVVLACVLVLIQGCRSTPARAPNASAPVGPAEPEPANWSNQSSSTLAPLPVDSASGLAMPGGSAQPLTSLSPAERARIAPTRPANPSAYISTDMPAALAPPPAEPVTYVVRSGDSLWKIARAHDTTTGEIQKLNPTIKASSLRPGMIIKVPGTTSSSSSPAAFVGAGPGLTSTASSASYVVRPGDSLSKIAARNGTTVAALREANNLRSDVIQIGQEIMVPGGAADVSSNAFSIGEAPLPPPGSRTNTATAGDAGNVTIVVQRGDTLGAIARKFDVTVRDIMAENDITDPTKVRVGQKLVIPGFHAVGTGAVPATPAPARGPATTPPTTAPVTDSPPELAPPVDPSPPELDAPPVQPIEGEPMPAP